MKHYLVLLTAVILLSGCAAARKDISFLTNGLSREEVSRLWGNPAEKVFAGFTMHNNYPVELWEYRDKGLFRPKKAREYILVFVDGELYAWTMDDPEVLFKVLEELGIFERRALEEELLYQQQLQEITDQALRTRRLMEILQTHQNLRNTQMQMQYQFQQQQLQYQRLIQPRPAPALPQRQQKP